MEEQTQRTRIFQQIQDVYGNEAEYLWANYPDYAVFRHPASKKWYAVFLRVPKKRLGLPGDGDTGLLNVRCSPLMTGSLLAEDGFLPGYHMNKNTWISICLDASVPDSQIALLLDWSYHSVAPKPRRKNKRDHQVEGESE